MSAMVPFYKMNGLGNKIIVADMRGLEGMISSSAAIALADEKAVPFDQIMELHDPKNPTEDAVIRILNADGSEAEACGNGTRCVVSYMAKENEKRDWLFRTKPGLLISQLQDNGLVSVNMGLPRFEWDQIPLEEEFGDTTGIELQIGPIDDPVLHTPSVANMGNPHAIFWVDQDVWSYDLDRFGPLLENHPIFPERANITIAQVVSTTHVIIRTWERGVGLTLACGSAACATLVSAVRKELTERVAVITVPGGDLKIEWQEDGTVLMTGPTEFEFEGRLDAETGSFEITSPVSS